MNTKRVSEYRKHGVHFAGKLVVVEYFEELQNDPRHKTLGIALAYEYRDKAARLIEEEGYTVQRILLNYPDYVVRVR